MTEQEWLGLKEKDLVINIQALRPTVGTPIPELTIHVVVVKHPGLIETRTVDIAEIQCVFIKVLALQLLQKYETPKP